jgi:hypothetical protein
MTLIVASQPIDESVSRPSNIITPQFRPEVLSSNSRICAPRIGIQRDPFERRVRTAALARDIQILGRMPQAAARW